MCGNCGEVAAAVATDPVVAAATEAVATTAATCGVSVFHLFLAFIGGAAAVLVGVWTQT